MWVFSTTLLQWQTADEYRGRVFATEAAFNSVNILAAKRICESCSGTRTGSRLLWRLLSPWHFVLFASTWFAVQAWWGKDDAADYAVAIE